MRWSSARMRVFLLWTLYPKLVKLHAAAYESTCRALSSMRMCLCLLQRTGVQRTGLRGMCGPEKHVCVCLSTCSWVRVQGCVTIWRRVRETHGLSTFCWGTMHTYAHALTSASPRPYGAAWLRMRVKPCHGEVLQLACRSTHYPVLKLVR